MKTISLFLDYGSATQKRTVCLVAVLALSLLPSATPASETSLTPLRPGDRPTGLIEYQLGSYYGSGFWHFSGLYTLPFHQSLRFDHGGNGAVTAYFVTGDTNTPVLVGTVTGRPSGSDSVKWVRLWVFSLRGQFCLSDIALPDLCGLVHVVARRQVTCSPGASLFASANCQRAASRKHVPRIGFTRCRTIPPIAPPLPKPNPSRAPVL